MVDFHLGGGGCIPAKSWYSCLCTSSLYPGQPFEKYYTLLAYWYVGTPHSDHVAPNLTCIQYPLPRPSPLLQSTSNTQILGSHLSSRPSWAGTFSSQTILEPSCYSTNNVPASHESKSAGPSIDG